MAKKAYTPSKTELQKMLRFTSYTESDPIKRQLERIDECNQNLEDHDRKTKRHVLERAINRAYKRLQDLRKVDRDAFAAEKKRLSRKLILQGPTDDTIEAIKEFVDSHTR